MEHLIPGFPELSPLGRFALIVLLALLVPPLCHKARLPSCVGFILAGILIGPHLLDLIPREAPAVEIAADLGKLLLMFFVGLEVDLRQFSDERRRAMLFGLATFALPMAAGIAAGFIFGYAAVAAVVIGSLLASHTLIAYPQVIEAGAGHRASVTITVGATVMTDMLSLLVLAGCLATHRTGFDAVGLVLQTLGLLGFAAFMLFVVGPACHWLIPRLPRPEDHRPVLLILLILVALASMLAEALDLEGIIGAFLAGLAVNRAVQGLPAKERLSSIGEGFLIPAFFIATGFLVDMQVMREVMTRELPLVLTIVLGLILSKWAAAEWMGRRWRFPPFDRALMATLTMPQVAATLAAALVARQALNAAGEPLLDARMLNAVLVLVVVTSILGPILTQRSLKRGPP